MTLDELLEAAKEYHARGDMVGLYRFARESVANAGNPHDEGIARTLLAEVFVRWNLGSPMVIQAELGRARALLRPYPEEQAYVMLVHLLWRAGENDVAAVQLQRSAFEKLCMGHPDRPGVQRWKGRTSSWLGRLALMRGDLATATEHYERSLVEYQEYEPDPESRDQLARMSKLHLAQFALRRHDLPTARRYLDDCDGATFSRLWETIRACAEVQYAILGKNAERARFWIRVARSWETPQSEAGATLTFTEAKLSYALGELGKARLLTLEARRMAARSKQDQLLPEIREFFRVQETGEGAGQLAQGGIPHDEAYGSVAAPVPVPSGGYRSRRR